MPKYIPKGHVAILWNAKDQNNEKLLYSLALQGEQGVTWKTLEEELEAQTYFLDTTTLPDGSYFVKVTATDRSHNPPEFALSAEKISERFEVDNTAPQISIALNQKQDSGKEAQVIIVVQDQFSRLQHAEYSFDAGEWISVFPDDQVTDSRDEKYSISLSDLTPDVHMLMFKATDIFQNVGVGKIQFTLSEPAQTNQP